MWHDKRIEAQKMLVPHGTTFKSAAGQSCAEAKQSLVGPESCDMTSFPQNLEQTCQMHELKTRSNSRMDLSNETWSQKCRPPIWALPLNHSNSRSCRCLVSDSPLSRHTLFTPSSAPNQRRWSVLTQRWDHQASSDEQFCFIWMADTVQILNPKKADLFVDSWLHWLSLSNKP